MKTVIAVAKPCGSAPTTAGVMASRPPTKGSTSVRPANTASASELFTWQKLSRMKVKTVMQAEVMSWPRM